MKRIIYIILIGSLCARLHAADNAPFAAVNSVPSATMQSVNSSAYMSSGSTFTSTVYSVGASAPSPTASPRKAPPGGGGESGYDPNNPQFSSIGDALWPMLWMILAYGIVAFIRRKKNEERNLKN